MGLQIALLVQNLVPFKDGVLTLRLPRLFIAAYRLKYLFSMFYKLIFKNLSESGKLRFLREHGVSLGVRMRENRKVFIYMVKDFFVEVLYQHDNSEGDAEKLNVFDSLKGLNSYLEKEFKTAF